MHTQVVALDKELVESRSSIRSIEHRQGYNNSTEYKNNHDGYALTTLGGQRWIGDNEAAGVRIGAIELAEVERRVSEAGTQVVQLRKELDAAHAEASASTAEVERQR